MMRHFIAAILILFNGVMFLASTGFAASDAGSESALYLGTGARAVAMGRTGVTETRYASAMDWNAAGLAFVPALSVSLQHAVLFGDALHESLAIAYPTMDWGTAGLTVNRIEVGAIERRDARNLPAGYFEMMEQQFSLAYGYNFWGPFAAGLTLKSHNLRLDGMESIAPGVDAGLLFKLPFKTNGSNAPAIIKEVRIGAAVRNLYPPILELNANPDQLYTNYRFGGALTLCFFKQINDAFTLSVDAEKPERSDLRWHTGLEYMLYDTLAIRGGWDHEYFSAGAGIQYAGMTFDYAISFPEIGMRHLMTFSMKLGRDVQAMRDQRAAEEEKRRQAIIDKLKNKIIEDYRRQAKALTEKGDYQSAVPLWEKVLDWEPDNKDIQERLQLAKAAVLRKQNTESLRLANNHYSNQRYIDVMVECRTVLERDPENKHAKKLYARAEKKAEGLGKKAIVTNVKMIKNIRKAYQKGLQAYTARDWSEAIKHWETVIENTPLQKQVYRYLRYARTHLEDSKTARAKKSKLSRKAAKKRKLYKDAVGQAKSGDLKGAMKSWEKLVKENPDDKDAKKNLDETKKNLIDSQKKGIRW